jgi:site-specific recombinase XerD
MRISQAFDAYSTNYMAIRHQSIRIRETHDAARKLLMQYLGDKDMSEITIQDISYWVREMRKTRCLNTVRNYITRLRVVASYCELLDIPCIKSALIPIPKREATVPAFLTEEEVTKMIDRAYNIRNAFIISLLYSSGIRLSELIQLNRGQIIDNCFTVIGKGSKPRVCFIDNRTSRLMALYCATRHDNCDALIISNQTQKRLTKTNIELLVKNSARRAGITDKRVTPHTLRHSFATNFLRNNGNMRYLSAMLGHTSMQTTMQYAHVVDVDLRKQYEKYHSC